MPLKQPDPHAYIIEELRRAGDDRYWKLHWLGDVYSPDSRMPLIEASFVPLADPSIDPDKNPPQLLENKSYLFGQAKTLKVDVSRLLLYSIGTFFRHGLPVSRPDFTAREFKDVRIESVPTAAGVDAGAPSVKIIPAWKHRDVGRDSNGEKLWEYLINFKEYRLWGMNLNARCLLVNITQSNPDHISKLIIPCVEIIRFHYANSPGMLREVFSGGALRTPNRIFDAKQTRMPGADGHNGHVRLSNFVSDEDAPIVARMAFDPYALAETNYIYRSMDINNNRVGQYLPEARFPFVGPTVTLVVHGKVIRSGAELYFLVFWIERCSGPFPFKTFEFDRDDGGIRSDVDPGRPYPTWPQPPHAGPEYVQNQPGEEIRRSNSTVELSNLKELVSQLPAKQKFTDLERKDWWERSKDRVTYPTQPVEEVISPSGGMSPSQPSGPVDKPVILKPNRDVTERTGAIKASFGLFMRIVTRLNSPTHGMVCRVIEVPQQGRPVHRFAPSMFPTALKETALGFSYVTMPGEGRRRRQVLIAEGIYRESRYFYLMEIEPQPPIRKKRPKKEKKDEPTTFTLFVCYDKGEFKQLDGDTLRGVLAYCASHRGAWLKDDEMTELGKHKVNHRSKSVSRYVERIKSELARGRLL